jgi:hypothetical protein
MAENEQRRARRFELRLPLEVLRSGSDTVLRHTETKNLSSAGVMFSSEAELSIGDAVEYTITLPAKTKTAPPVRLRCLGTVVRLGPNTRRNSKDKPFDVAVTLERYEFERTERPARDARA